MFNELNGVIIWDFKDGKLVYSLTKDGDLNWNMITHKMNVKSAMNEIQHISYSSDGQVTLVFSEKYILEADRKKVIIVQSNDFGKSFHTL